MASLHRIRVHAPKTSRERLSAGRRAERNRQLTRHATSLLRGVPCNPSAAAATDETRAQCRLVRKRLPILRCPITQRTVLLTSGRRFRVRAGDSRRSRAAYLSRDCRVREALTTLEHRRTAMMM
jgi:hypothetical protein